jgi:hypothetical protein
VVSGLYRASGCVAIGRIELNSLLTRQVEVTWNNFLTSIEFPSCLFPSSLDVTQISKASHIISQKTPELVSRCISMAALNALKLDHTVKKAIPRNQFDRYEKPRNHQDSSLILIHFPTPPFRRWGSRLYTNDSSAVICTCTSAFSSLREPRLC